MCVLVIYANAFCWSHEWKCHDEWYQRITLLSSISWDIQVLPLPIRAINNSILTALIYPEEILAAPSRCFYTQTSHSSTLLKCMRPTTPDGTEKGEKLYRKVVGFTHELKWGIKHEPSSRVRQFHPAGLRPTKGRTKVSHWALVQLRTHSFSKDISGSRLNGFTTENYCVKVLKEGDSRAKCPLRFARNTFCGTRTHRSKACVPSGI